MTAQFEVDVRSALEIFVAAITSAAERAAIEGLHSAFQRAFERVTQAGHAMGAVGNESPPPKEHAHRRAPAQIDRAAMRERIVAFIRDNPGCNTTQLSRSLGAHRSRLRRQLRNLADNRAIRIEERSPGFGRQLHRTYFVVEPGNGASAHTEASIVPAEPEHLTTSVEAMA